MYLYEYQGKELLARRGLRLPQGKVVTAALEAQEEAAALGGEVVVKAQVRAGGRGNAGLVKKAASPQEAAVLAGGMLGTTYRGETVRCLLIEEKLAVEQEFYLGVSLDYGRGCPVALLSTSGGVDIERVAEDDPGAVASMALPATGPPSLHLVTELVGRVGLKGRQLLQVRDMLWYIVQLFYQLDAVTVEINPAVWCSDGRLVAADAKIMVDDAALGRQPDVAPWAVVPEDAGQRAALENRLGYVCLDNAGDVGIIAGGAGLCLATMDAVFRLGGKPVSFLDLGGGVSVAQMEAAIKITLQTAGVRGIIINVYGGINNCYTMARGIAATMDNLKAEQTALVVKMRGHSQDEGWALLEQSGISVIKTGTTEQAVRKLLSKISDGQEGRESGHPSYC